MVYELDKFDDYNEVHQTEVPYNAREVGGEYMLETIHLYELGRTKSTWVNTDTNRNVNYAKQLINDKLDEQLFLKINNGKILIIDDSFGSGVTMRESARAIKHLNPKTVDAFILLHDYAPTAKKTG